MTEKSIFKLQSGVCKALANPLRIEIIAVLNNGELSFGDILKKLDISKSNLSQHLSVMVSNGLLAQRKEGTNSYFRLSSEKVSQACTIMRELLLENLNSKINLFIK